MRRRFYLTLAILVAGWIGYRAYKIATTGSHSPRETIQHQNDGLQITVAYGRPYKKGRLIFGDAKDRTWFPNDETLAKLFRLMTGLPPTSGALVPNNVYWRLGANEATEIDISENIIFGDQAVVAGKYRMYAVPNSDTWDVVLNSELGQFGLNEPHHELDVVRVTVPVQTAPLETEQFTIRFSNDSSSLSMQFLWDKTLVAVPIRRNNVMAHQ